MNKQECIDRVILILSGIDKTDSDSNDGWFETSEGASFGKKALDAVISAINQIEVDK